MLKIEQKQIKTILAGTSAHFSVEFLIEKAFHDSLTGLPNRFLFEEIFKVSVKHAKRNSKRLALFYIDLDNFKKVNDSYGHKVGDEVLRDVADILRLTIREADLIARIGGDEFVVLAEMDYSQTPEELLERMFDSVVNNYGKNIGITLSVGVPLYPDHGSAKEMLLDRADQALYAVKKSGKNGYRIFSF